MYAMMTSVQTRHVRGGVIFLVGLLVLCSLASASVELKNIQNRALLDEGFVYLWYGEVKTNEFIQGSFEFPAATGMVAVLFDDLDTRGRDYYRLVDAGDVESEILLLPVGSLHGEVKDSLENLVGEAQLRFDCGDGQFALPDKTDQFGGFVVPAMPIGDCHIVAKRKDAVGAADVLIEHGELKTITIVLDRTVLEPQSTPVLALVVGIGVVLLLFILVIYFIFRKRGKKVVKEGLNEESKDEEVKKGSRSEDIMKTLGRKEKAVVQFLLEQGNKSSQAQIRHNTGIPRTSLTRVLMSLESKQIIKSDKLGKMVKVELTDWFLEK
jgi:cbb3-type cytochrome oxidase subunit 3